MIGELKDIWIVFRKAYNEHFALNIKHMMPLKGMNLRWIV